MKALIIPDAFKDSLSASEVATSMRKGIHDLYPDAKIFHIAASDGGEGFLNSVHTYVESLNEFVSDTIDPLGRPIRAPWLFSPGTKTAYIELARASGLELLSGNNRNPCITSTYGTGLQIRDAIEKGATSIYLGIGGSATNDAGTGIATALGYKFLDKNGNQLQATGENLSKIRTVLKPDKDFSYIRFVAINDVLNPLFGIEGAAFTYAKQKGAGPEEIVLLDKGLEHLSKIISEQLGNNYANTPGAGAAGGTAFGLKSFFNADFISGVSFVLKLARFRELITSETIDAIITGEGCIDSQTAYGKLVFGVVTEASSIGIPVLAVCGKLNLDSEGVKKLGLAAAAELYHPDQAPGYSYEHASELVRQRTRELLKSITPV
jgi:glycerate kinase